MLLLGIESFNAWPIELQLIFIQSTFVSYGIAIEMPKKEAESENLAKRSVARNETGENTIFVC